MKAFNRTKRLKLAPRWISIYNGKNLVRGYARHFGVDLICAITEMRMLGFTVSGEYESAVKRSIAERILQKKKKREARTANLPDDLYTGEFEFIVGYTSNGLPYGVPREKTEETDETDGPFLF